MVTQILLEAYLGARVIKFVSWILGSAEDHGEMSQSLQLLKKVPCVSAFRPSKRDIVCRVVVRGRTAFLLDKCS